MAAYELREHRTDHGYNVLGRYATVDEAWAHKLRLIAEDRQRQGRYTIDYTQNATPDMPDTADTPEVSDTPPVDDAPRRSRAARDG